MRRLPPRRIARAMRLLVTVVIVLFAQASVATAPASALPLTGTHTPLAATYTGWAYVASTTGSAPAWRWSEQGWAATTFPAGTAVWVSPWGAGWTWAWRGGAWHAVATTSLRTWTCAAGAPIAPLEAPVGSVIRSGNASTAPAQATVGAEAVVSLRCGNGFADAAGGATTFALVTVSGGATSVTGYLDARLIVAPGGTYGRSVVVASVGALLDALDDDGIAEIVVANGTYHVSPSSAQQDDSLWIGPRYADRTRPVLVRAQTRGGVTFDGGGATYWGCMTFVGGAHHQTWDGFRCANGTATHTGIVVVGAHADYMTASPHHLTLRHFTILPSCRGVSTSSASPATDHAVYISEAPGEGPHDLLFEDWHVDGRGGLSSAFHFYHSRPGIPNAANVTIRRTTVIGTQQAFILWDPTLRNVTIDTATVTGALSYAVRYETTGSTGIMLANITSTGSGSRGFYSNQGSSPAGVSFSNNSFG